MPRTLDLKSTIPCAGKEGQERSEEGSGKRSRQEQQGHSHLIPVSNESYKVLGWAVGGYPNPLMSNRLPFMKHLVKRSLGIPQSRQLACQCDSSCWRKRRSLPRSPAERSQSKPKKRRLQRKSRRQPIRQSRRKRSGARSFDKLRPGGISEDRRSLFGDVGRVSRKGPESETD